MFEGFEPFEVEGDGARIHGRVGGPADAPPVLLLHGYPQTHAMWRHVAPPLARRFRVVCADLRGYGGSSKPPSDPDHAAYSKRATARDLVRVMERLGAPAFAVVGHDRGGRVGHRMALDHPDRVRRLAVLDIAPTREMYAGTTDAFARDYWHWFFLIQPAPLPERMIGADPEGFWRAQCARGSAGLAPFDGAVDGYVAAFRDPETIRATCEDYRAAATIDLRHDDEDGGARVACPVLALWGEHGAIERHFDALALWRLRAERVEGHAVPAGHYLAEERPDLVTPALESFLAEADEPPDDGR